MATRLRLGAGFAAHERARVVEVLVALDARLVSHPADSTELELSAKDRGRAGQKLTLVCWIAGRPRVVATSSLRRLPAALAEVRDDLRRQLDDAKTRSEPRNNRHLRPRDMPPGTPRPAPTEVVMPNTQRPEMRRSAQTRLVQDTDGQPTGDRASVSREHRTVPPERLSPSGPGPERAVASVEPTGRRAEGD